LWGLVRWHRLPPPRAGPARGHGLRPRPLEARPPAWARPWRLEQPSVRVCNPGACSSGCGQHPAAHTARWARPLPGSPVTHGVRPRRLGCGSDGCAASRARLHGSAAPAAPRRAALPRRPQPRRCGGGSLRPGARWPSHSSSGHGSQRGLPSCSGARRPRLRVLSGAGTSPGGLDSALYGARAWPVRGVAPTARTAALAWPSTARGVARGGPRPWQQRGRGGQPRHTARARVPGPAESRDPGRVLVGCRGHHRRLYSDTAASADFQLPGAILPSLSLTVEEEEKKSSVVVDRTYNFSAGAARERISNSLASSCCSPMKKPTMVSKAFTDTVCYGLFFACYGLFFARWRARADNVLKYTQW
jgi:hypothetical protein